MIALQMRIGMVITELTYEIIETYKLTDLGEREKFISITSHQSWKGLSTMN